MKIIEMINMAPSCFRPVALLARMVVSFVGKRVVGFIPSVLI
jgi:hypothetical protein